MTPPSTAPSEVARAYDRIAPVYDFFEAPMDFLGGRRRRERVVGEARGPVTRRLFGPELNRRTERNVLAAGLELVTVERNGIWREIVARPGACPTGRSRSDAS